MTTSIGSILLENRPNLATNTIKTYTSIIKNLYLRINERIGGIKIAELVDYFKTNKEAVLNFLKDMPPNKRKTILASLIALLGKDDAEEYREQMIKDAERYNTEQRKQKKTQAQTDNWLSQDQIMEIYHQLERDTKHLFAKNNLSMAELQALQNYVILSVYVLIPPRRLLDYTAFKVRNVDLKNDNYMKGNQFVFNNYKTKSKYGQQVVKIPVKLRNIIQKWTKKHGNDHLLFTERNTPLAQSRLTQTLNKIFGRNLSVNMLRHIFISDRVLPDQPLLNTLESVAEDMGHSVETQMLYKKV